MRVRADQVRAGHRIDGATVMRVRPTLDWGMVRITVENTRDEKEIAASGIANGTFCYLADDVLDVEGRAPEG